MAIRLSRPTEILNVEAKIDQCLPVVPYSDMHYIGADKPLAAASNKKVSRGINFFSFFSISQRKRDKKAQIQHPIDRNTGQQHG